MSGIGWNLSNSIANILVVIGYNSETCRKARKKNCNFLLVHMENIVQHLNDIHILNYIVLLSWWQKQISHTSKHIYARASWNAVDISMFFFFAFFPVGVIVVYTFQTAFIGVCRECFSHITWAKQLSFKYDLSSFRHHNRWKWSAVLRQVKKSVWYVCVWYFTELKWKNLCEW